MTLEAYFWIFVATLVGFNLGSYVERMDDPEPTEVVEQVCVDELFPSDRKRQGEWLSSEMKREDI